MARSWWQTFVPLHDSLAASLAAIAEFQPDIIHVHGTENPYGLLAKYTDIPMVLSLQGLLTMCQRFFFHGLGMLDVAHLAISREALLASSEIHGYWRCAKMAEREREIVRSNSDFIGRTDWDRAFVDAINPNARYFHCDELMRPIFYETEWKPHRAEQHILYTISSSMLFKGLECLLEAIGLLYRSGYSNIRLRVAGVPEGSQVFRFYQRQAQKYGIAPIIEWLGRVGSDWIERIIARR
jgi:glycosyltransferase involved in cell wall biosynthesis